MLPSQLAAAGACRAVANPDIFFDEQREHEALAVCAGCRVRGLCRDYALGHEEFGVWGGTTPSDRHERRRPGPWLALDDRARADRIRRRLLAGVPRVVVAAEEAVSLRTLERWIAASGLRAAASSAAA